MQKTTNVQFWTLFKKLEEGVEEKKESALRRSKSETATSEVVTFIAFVAFTLISSSFFVGSQFSDFFKTPEKNSEKGTVLLIDNQQFSNFLELV